MSIYTIETYQLKSNIKVLIVVKKNIEQFTVEIKSECNKISIVKKNQKLSDVKIKLKEYNVPLDFVERLENQENQEVYLFKDDKISHTNWLYTELNDFDKILYRDNSYEIIKLLREHKIDYNFFKCSEYFNLNIIINKKSILFKDLEQEEFNTNKLTKIEPLKKLIDNLYKFNGKDIYIDEDINKENITYKLKQPL